MIRMANIDNILDFMISGKQQVSQAKATYNDLKVQLEKIKKIVGE